MEKQLKVNMIFGGTYYSFGTVLEEDEIPLNLRKTKYLQEPLMDRREATEEFTIDDLLEEAAEQELLEPEPKARIIRSTPKKKK
jgi:hypothetical protein